MPIILNQPELEALIDEQVKSGRFPSREAAVATAVQQMMHDNTNYEMDDQTSAAIDRAEEQVARGECIDFKTFAAAMRAKMGIK